MIRLVEALNYRCLRYVKQELGDFHVLVGPNASGKTTFLDVIAFLGDFVSEGLEKAIQKRTMNFQDLMYSRQGTRFELALELELPEEKKALFPSDKPYERIRYEVAIQCLDATSQIEIVGEKGVLLTAPPMQETAKHQRTLFPFPADPPPSILMGRLRKEDRRVFTKVPGGNDNYYSEVYHESGKGWVPSFRLGPTKSTLANLPADDTKFPVSTWLRDVLSDGVQRLMLNSLKLRGSSPPGQGTTFRPDGSNLPWVIHKLRSTHPDRHKEWISHLRTALPDLLDVETVEIKENRHRHLKLIYANGLEVPSWMGSDGTLRLLALTLLAYLPEFEGVYLIEEPENGIHPLAIETAFQSLKSAYSAQILLATHSPIILSHSDPVEVLCFKKDDSGATDMVLGSEHPDLRGWRKDIDLSVLYASGVLG